MILVVGNPKTGKTRAVSGFPDPWILDCNHNLFSVAEVESSLPINYDFLDIDAVTNQPIEHHKQWDYAMRLITARGNDPKYKTLIIDDLGILIQALIAKLFQDMRADPKNSHLDNLRITDYGRLLTTIINTFTELKKCKKTVIVTSHQTLEKDDTGAFKYALAIPGQASVTLPGLFTDVIGLDTKPAMLNQTAQYFIYTRPSGRHVNLGTTNQLPSEINITNKLPSEIYKLLA